jgi:hypothetical protein
MYRFTVFLSFFAIELILELVISLSLNHFVQNNYFDSKLILRNLLYFAVIKLPFILLLNAIVSGFIFYDLWTTQKRTMIYLFGLIVIQILISVLVFRDNVFNLSFVNHAVYGIRERLFVISVILLLIFNKKIMSTEKV